MKNFVLAILLIFLVSESTAQQWDPFEPVIIGGPLSLRNSETPAYFYVVDTITIYDENDFWNNYYHFKVFSLDSLKTKQSQVLKLQDSLNVKLNSSDISSWAKQPLKPIYGISEISNTNDIYGNLTHHTTTEILAILSPIIGKIYYNSTLNQLVFYDGTAWQKLPVSPM